LNCVGFGLGWIEKVEKMLEWVLSNGSALFDAGRLRILCIVYFTATLISMSDHRWELMYSQDSFV
jgi:hypothetical protein